VFGIPALILLAALWPFVQVDAGHAGVVLNWGAASGTVWQPGLHVRVPLMQKVAVIDTRTVKHEVQALSYSKDIQTVDAKVALDYHVDADSVNYVYQNIGRDYEVRVVDPSIQESVKAATAKFTAQELIEQRPKVKDEIKAQLVERLSPKHLIVDDFSIINFDFSTAYEQAIDAKQVAQQKALQAENDLKRIEIEKEQRIAQAQGEAEAIKIQAEAINNQGGANYVQIKALDVQAKAIEKWNGKLPDQFVPGSALPFINLQNIK
jgi:regulator of protease activity HflC (stomatin/prohibitin superfamily)